MLSVLLLISFGQTPTSEKPVLVETARQSCEAAYFSRLVNAHGAPRSWAANKIIPDEVKSSLGEKISDVGVVADGYNYWLLRTESNSDRAYVIEMGGLSGEMRVFGPFPLPKCTQSNT